MTRTEIYAQLTRKFGPVSRYITDEHARAALDSLLWDLAGGLAELHELVDDYRKNGL